MAVRAEEITNIIKDRIQNFGQPVTTTDRRPVEKIAPNVVVRQSVNQPLYTGIKPIDAMTAIGRGQRELIIGDRQTGKSAVALDAILNQQKGDVVCVYVAIGQKA